MSDSIRLFGAGLLFAFINACGATPAPKPALPSVEDIAPEAATGRHTQPPVFARKYMAGAANPHASNAGASMLARGGSAVDAVIAMAMVLTLVEPQSSGIGGGAFMLHFDPVEAEVTAYDGRETAPASATPDMFIGPNGEPRHFFDAVVGGRSIGVPGLIRMLKMAHDAHGKLPWKDLFAPAIALSESGFEISDRLHHLLMRDATSEHLPEPLRLRAQADAGPYFYDSDGQPWPVGTKVTNLALAGVLRDVADHGPDAFYTGPLAAEIARAAREAPRHPSGMTVGDLAGYRPLERKAVCRPYRDWQICGMPPPTSGGVTLLQILGILEMHDLSALSPDGPELVHLFVEAARLAYADRGLYLADPDFVDVPVDALLDSAYLRQRAGLIDSTRRLESIAPGRPAGISDHWSPDASLDLPSTSHMVAVDAEGRSVSMTASIENAFGSKQMVRGFLLNNELTDFSFVPEKDAKPVANRVQSGKRPRSSMAPVIVLDRSGKQFVAAIGSPGGSRIILYVARTLIGILDYGFDVQRAIEQPNFLCRGGAVELEAAPGYEVWVQTVKTALEARGHEVDVRDLNSGLQGIRHRPYGYEGGADPRREGLIVGE